MMDGVDIIVMERNDLKEIDALVIAMETHRYIKIHHLRGVKVANEGTCAIDTSTENALAITMEICMPPRLESNSTMSIVQIIIQKVAKKRRGGLIAIRHIVEDQSQGSYGKKTVGS